jgi:putative oxidoreductase
MFEQATAAEQPNPIGDWAGRGAIALIFALMGWEKFNVNSMWPSFFQQLGWGEWFRYFTGVVEILGGILVLIPWTANAGLALLAATMGSAALIHIFVMGHPGNCVIPLAFFLGLAGFGWSRWNR